MPAQRCMGWSPQFTGEGKQIQVHADLKRRNHIYFAENNLFTWTFLKIPDMIIGTSLILQGHQKMHSCIFMGNIKKLENEA